MKKMTSIRESDQAYGRIEAFLHVAGYTMAKAFQDMNYLLDEKNRWKEFGFGNVNKFLTSFNFKEIEANLETRKALAKRIKELQPAVSTRQIAKTVGLNESTLRAGKTAAGRQKAKGKQRAGAGVPAGRLSGGEVAKLGQKQEDKGAKEQERKKEREAFEARRDKGARVGDLIAMAEGGEKFGVIYADPPWEFHTYSGKGKQRSAERYYDTDSLDAIKALPVGNLAADKCSLFLWCVWPELPGALEVIKAWGFEYKTVAFAWVKMTEKAEWIASNGEGLHWGMGYWTRANTEVCLLATRGEPKRMDEGVHQVVVAPVGEHSVKPEEVRQRIERLVLGPYLELFARRPVLNWTVWGNELETTKEAAE